MITKTVLLPCFTCLGHKTVLVLNEERRTAMIQQCPSYGGRGEVVQVVTNGIKHNEEGEVTK